MGESMAPTVNISQHQLGVLRSYLGERYSPNTVSAFTSQSHAFILTVGPKQQYSRGDVLRFTDALIKRGYKGKSITTILAGVRALFRALQIPWPLDRADMHLGLPVEDDAGPTIAPQDVATLIANSGKLGYPDLQLLALSTTYGFRNSELADLLTSGCNGRSINLQTAKSGRKRVHGIPAPLSTILAFGPQQMSTRGTHERFDVVMRQCLREPLKGEGWHALRRSLATGFKGSGLDSYYMARFMGWKVAETGFRYFRPEAAEVDAKAYGAHPFLRLWSTGQQPSSTDQ